MGDGIDAVNFYSPDGSGIITSQPFPDPSTWRLPVDSEGTTGDFERSNGQTFNPDFNETVGAVVFGYDGDRLPATLDLTIGVVTLADDGPNVPDSSQSTP